MLGLKALPIRRNSLSLQEPGEVRCWGQWRKAWLKSEQKSSEWHDNGHNGHVASDGDAYRD